MTIAEARSMLSSLPVDRKVPGRWVDLGCGTGTFTLALAELLPARSTIIAVDRDRSALNAIPGTHARTSIEHRMADIERVALDDTLDGLLMANALHYVADQRAFLERVLPHVRPGGNFLLVEYDTDKARAPWVPFPLSLRSAIVLFAEVGFTQHLKLGERRSIYSSDHLYAVVFTR